MLYHGIDGVWGFTPELAWLVEDGMVEDFFGVNRHSTFKHKSNF
jgi:hypothetical protein